MDIANDKLLGGRTAQKNPSEIRTSGASVAAIQSKEKRKQLSCRETITLDLCLEHQGVRIELRQNFHEYPHVQCLPDVTLQRIGQATFPSSRKLELRS